MSTPFVPRLAVPLALEPAPAAPPATVTVIDEGQGEALALSASEGLDAVVLARADAWWVLLALPLAGLAYAWAARQRRRSLAALGDPLAIARLVASVSPAARVVRGAAVVLALAAIGVGLMRPQLGGQARVVPASGLDLVLAVDYSKSMLAQDVYPSRSERLEAELRRFLDRVDRRGDRVGLVVFAGEARGLPVTQDTRIVALYLEHADPRTEEPGGTAIGRALAKALEFLREARQQAASAQSEQLAQAGAAAVPDAALGRTEQAIVLLTDGEDNSSRPLEVAKEAARLGVRIYAVGIGSSSGEPIQTFDDAGQPNGFVTDEAGNVVMTRLDEPLLQQLAEQTGGRYVRVDTERFGLDAVAEVLDELATEGREDTVVIHRDEGFPFVVAPALALLCLGIAVPERRRARASGRAPAGAASPVVGDRRGA
jgi:Ca-activated chloride channel family protein